MMSKPPSKIIQKMARSRRDSSGPSQNSTAAPASQRPPAIVSCQVGQGLDMMVGSLYLHAARFSYDQWVISDCPFRKVFLNRRRLRNQSHVMIGAFNDSKKNVLRELWRP